MFGNLKEKLKRTREALKGRFDEILASEKSKEEILAQLTEALILTDAGISTTEKLIQNVREKSRKTDAFKTIKRILEDEVSAILSRFPSGLNTQQDEYIALFVGVNGGGKTTSLAKLAHDFQQKGKEVMIVAADTFRAAAQEQLSLWGKKLNIPVIKGQYKADPASVVFDAIQAFKSRGFQVLLIDTAGRIHTNTNLMNELEKIRRVISKEVEGAPHESFLVLDASIGQNALIQAREFLKFSGLTGIFLTKLDGTAKGGCALGISDELDLPIKLLGVGESEKDLSYFSPAEFTEALLS